MTAHGPRTHGCGRACARQVASVRDLHARHRECARAHARCRKTFEWLTWRTPPPIFMPGFARSKTTIRVAHRRRFTPFDRACSWHVRMRDLTRCGGPPPASSARTTLPRFRAPERAAERRADDHPIRLLLIPSDAGLWRAEPPAGGGLGSAQYYLRGRGDGSPPHGARHRTLVEIGRGWRPAANMADLVAGGARADAGATAPARGLFLVRVDYD